PFHILHHSATSPVLRLSHHPTTTETYPLSLHDALPISNITYWGAGNPSPKYDSSYRPGDNLYTNSALAIDAATGKIKWHHQYTRSEEHTSELQSPDHLVCRLLLEKKK